MRTISHSEACTYWDCQAKWDIIYNKNIRKSNSYLDFGVMAHKVLETREIPDECLYPSLKEVFNITSWKDYFGYIFKELDILLKDFEVVKTEYKIQHSHVSGIIDLVCKHKETDDVYLFDYKFTENAKSYEDIYLDEQLKIYSYLYHFAQWTDYSKIHIGYISIPKLQVSYPNLLKNGELSKSKSQATTASLYLEAIHKYNLKEEDYADMVEYYRHVQYIKIITSQPEEKEIDKVIENLYKTIYNICHSKVLYNNSSTKCKNCEYLKECKY